MSFSDKSCKDFTVELASKASVPGGGGASALCGALGCALGNMVGSLTVGKKKYADVEEEIKTTMDKAESVWRELLDLIQRDADVFEPLSKAYGLPKDTEEQRAYKTEYMEKCLRDACSVPMAIMEKCCESICLCKIFADKGSTLAISDAGVGVAFSKAALLGASLNVFINTKAMTDKDYAAALNVKANDMIAKYTVLADEIFAGVNERLK